MTKKLDEQPEFEINKAVLPMIARLTSEPPLSIPKTVQIVHERVQKISTLRFPESHSELLDPKRQTIHQPKLLTSQSTGTAAGAATFSHESDVDVHRQGSAAVVPYHASSSSTIPEESFLAKTWRKIYSGGIGTPGIDIPV